MSSIPVIASASDLPAAVRYADRNPAARWYVARRAAALGAGSAVPAEWGEPVTAAFRGDWTPPEREKAEESGEALPDGSFPIRDKEDLKRAIKAFGRAKDKPRAKRHIVKRARDLGAVELLPEGWNIGTVTAAGPNAAGKAKQALSAIVWNPNLHPRDKDGQFIESGGIVSISVPGGGKIRGKAVGVKGSKDDEMLTVQVPDWDEATDLEKTQKRAGMAAMGIQIDGETGTWVVRPGDVEGEGAEKKAEIPGSEGGGGTDVDPEDEDLFDGGELYVSMDERVPLETMNRYAEAALKYPQHREKLHQEAATYLDMENESYGYAEDPDPEFEAELAEAMKVLEGFDPAKPAPAAPTPEPTVKAGDPGAAKKIGLMSQSAVSKGIMGKSEADARIAAILANEDHEAAHKDLAKLMTELKLGGKQRKRYRELLDAHRGVEPDSGSAIVEAQAVSEGLSPDNPLQAKLDAAIAKAQASIDAYGPYPSVKTATPQAKSTPSATPTGDGMDVISGLRKGNIEVGAAFDWVEAQAPHVGNDPKRIDDLTQVIREARWRSGHTDQTKGLDGTLTSLVRTLWDDFEHEGNDTPTPLDAATARDYLDDLEKWDHEPGVGALVDALRRVAGGQGKA